MRSHEDADSLKQRPVTCPPSRAPSVPTDSAGAEGGRDDFTLRGLSHSKRWSDTTVRRRLTFLDCCFQDFDDVDADEVLLFCRSHLLIRPFYSPTLINGLDGAVSPTYMFVRTARLFSHLRPNENLCTSSFSTPSFSLIRSPARSIHTRSSKLPVQRPLPVRDHRFSSTFHQNSLADSGAYILAITAGCAYAYLITIYFNRSTELESEEARELSRLQEENLAIMAGKPPPGRPGNLTSEQETKLQELWSAVLHVFGVPDLSNGDDATAAHDLDPKARTDTQASEKQKKKKRLGIFSRKNRDGSNSAAATTTDAEAVTGDGEDKYGQTKEFHKTLENQTPEQLRTAFWSMVKHDDPDALLLRFLRARKWNVQNALIMLVATMNWRQNEMRVDGDIMRKGEGGALQDSASGDSHVKKGGNDFLAQLRMGKSFLHGSDKEGRPICCVRVHLHKSGDQSEASLERYTVYTIETARLLLNSHVDTAVCLLTCHSSPN